MLNLVQFVIHGPHHLDQQDDDEGLNEDQQRQHHYCYDLHPLIPLLTYGLMVYLLRPEPCSRYLLAIRYQGVLHDLGSNMMMF